ncbi:MAG: ParB/RepB/Spo0J family partition protein [Brevinematales bacterium]|nr:ParB/RepB/Spo0J family partition protein [Brevinematales bacterium]
MEKKTLLLINVLDIAPNPHNPRLVFNQDDLNDLKQSISKVGILVPITVYENTKNYPKEKYVLLDGERRWRCAKELGMNSIPANIIDEPEDVTQNILFMFNIHHFRTEWELFPTALKLEILINQLATESEKILSEFTGVNKSTIKKCKMLLWYPKKYRNILMEKTPVVSTYFFIELYPIVYRLSFEDEFLYGEKLESLIDSFINIFVKKDIIIDVKEFREIRKALAYYDNINDIKTFNNKLNEFIRNPINGVQIFILPEIENDINRKNILKYLAYLNENMKKVNPEIISDYYFKDQLEILLDNLKTLYDKID